MLDVMFDHFDTRHVDVGETSVFVRHGGDGPPVLLLHGHPRTSATWHRVAPWLVANGHTVVCPDLRGYGRSGKPLEIWADRADDLRGFPIESGHHMAEEAPEQLSGALVHFLAQ